MKNEEVVSSSFHKPLGDKSGFFQHVKFQFVLKQKWDNNYDKVKQTNYYYLLGKQ